MDSVDKIIKTIESYEKKFSRNQYNGDGEKPYNIIEGTGRVMISAPHSIKQFREDKVKLADKLTGGIAMYLQKVTGCHLIYSSSYTSSDPNYDSNENGGNPYQSSLKDYINDHNIKVLIDLHGASIKRPYAVEMGTAPSRNSLNQIEGNEYHSLKGDSFIADLIRYTFDYFFKDCPSSKKDIWINQIFDAGRQNTVTKFVCENTQANSIQLEINGEYRDVQNKENLYSLVMALKSIITMLGNCDWVADQHKAFRLWQSYKHKPQDEIQIKANNSVNSITVGSNVYISSLLNVVEMVRVHELEPENIVRIQESLNSTKNDIGEYAFLTNRLIENIFGREWSTESAVHPSLIGAPLIVNIYKNESYLMGLPKADRIDQVSFSTSLYNELRPYISDYDIAIYNRYCDSKMFVDMKKADYQDNGRVKDSNGLSAKKVMMPRYYKRLLGYLDKPLRMIRKDELLMLIRRIDIEVDNMLKRIYVQTDYGFSIGTESPDYEIINAISGLPSEPPLDASAFNELSNKIKDDIKLILTESYKIIPGEDFYQLSINDNDSSKKLIELEKYLGLYDEVGIIKIPKKKERHTFRQKLRRLYDIIIVWILKMVVGKNDYSMKVVWTSLTDDKNNVARLSSNMMKLLGISENDKIYIYFGGKKVVLRSLCNDDLSDYEIGIPAPARKKLGMGSVNDIVEVSRELKHVFLRHSQEQTIAILGLFLAVFQVVSDFLFGIYMCLILTPIVIYFLLNEERIKVK